MTTETAPGAPRMPSPADEHAIPAFLPCHPKDLPTLPFCIAALRRHPQVATISVIGEPPLEPHCERLGVRFIDELSLLERWFNANEPTGERRWYYQMFLKLSIAFAGEGLAVDRFLIMDADTVLLHSFPLIDETLDTVLHPRMSEHVSPYYAGMRELLGHEVAYEGSHNAHFMVFRAPIIRSMFAEFARVQSRPPDDGRSVLRAFLQTCDRHTLSFADYETYGYYARERFAGELTWADRRQLNVLYVHPSESVLDRLRPYYDYCSFHAYRRPNRLALQLAGSMWLRLRLARSRLANQARRDKPR